LWGQDALIVIPYTPTEAGCTTYGAESRWDLDANIYDLEGNHNLSAEDGASYVLSHVEGDSAGSTNGTDDHFLVPQFDYGATFSISMWFLTWDDTNTSYPRLYNGITSDDGFEIFVNFNADRIDVKTGNGVDVASAYSNELTIETGEWYHVLVSFDKTNGECLICFEGSDETDVATLRTDFETNTSAKIGTGDYQLWGYVDDVQVYLGELTASDAATIHTTPGTEVTYCE
jgi:hypothetical protein